MTKPMATKYIYNQPGQSPKTVYIIEIFHAGKEPNPVKVKKYYGSNVSVYDFQSAASDRIVLQSLDRIGTDEYIILHECDFFEYCNLEKDLNG